MMMGCYYMNHDMLMVTVMLDSATLYCMQS